MDAVLLLSLSDRKLSPLPGAGYPYLRDPLAKSMRLDPSLGCNEAIRMALDVYVAGAEEYIVLRIAAV